MHSIIRWSAALAALPAMAAFSGAGVAKAQEAAGDWHGTLSAGASQFRLGVTLKPKPGGGYEGVLLSPDQTPAPIPLNGVKAEGGVLSFSIDAAHASYSGRWDEGRKAWVGEWSQGAALPLVLTAGKPDPLPVVAGLDGDWAATVPIPTGAKIRLILHVRSGPGGTAVTLDSPDQLAYGIPIPSLTKQGQKVGFSITAPASRER